MEDLKIKQFLASNFDFGYGTSSGYGSGFGDGSGYGCGCGSGYGNGSSFGSGNGNGSGYGYAYGTSFGYGYGTSNGSGDVLGSGDGYGSGYGGGIGKVNGLTVYDVDSINVVFYSIHKNVARGAIFNGDFTFTPCYIVKGNGYFAHGETIKEAMEMLENKIFKTLDVEERIEKFVDEFELNKKYPAMKFYEWHNKLTGSCEMGRKSFAKDHNIDLENDKFTVQEFIKITERSYGSSVILQLKERLGL